MSAAPFAMQEATDAAFRTLEGIAVNIEQGFRGKATPSDHRRQARRMREALDVLRAELDFHDPPVEEAAACK